MNLQKIYWKRYIDSLITKNAMFKNDQVNDTQSVLVNKTSFLNKIIKKK